jgi:hypothetical protein
VIVKRKPIVPPSSLLLSSLAPVARFVEFLCSDAKDQSTGKAQISFTCFARFPKLQKLCRVERCGQGDLDDFTDIVAESLPLRFLLSRKSAIQFVRGDRAAQGFLEQSRESFAEGGGFRSRQAVLGSVVEPREDMIRVYVGWPFALADQFHVTGQQGEKLIGPAMRRIGIFGELLIRKLAQWRLENALSHLFGHTAVAVADL